MPVSDTSGTSSDTDTTDSSGGSTGATTGDTTKGTTGNPDCPDGNLFCSCNDDGSCNDAVVPLTCYAASNTCIEDPCPAGTEGCACEMGTTGCDAPLDCVNGFCIDQSGPMCVTPYDPPCWDNAAGSLGECCTGTACYGSEADNQWGCVPQCTSHGDCTTGCCLDADGLGDYRCSISVSLCQAVGYCIDTCMDANDGWCDDGGPGSDYSICELGTDCADCGTRDF